MQFDAFAARLVSERTWHESQRFREAKDGSAILELELGGLEEIERWILSWGSHVTVISPPDLVRRVRAEARSIADKYPDTAKLRVRAHPRSRRRFAKYLPGSRGWPLAA